MRKLRKSKVIVVNEESVMAFARQQISMVLGNKIPQCFLAGGAFKTMITGQPPRDLDVWGETEEARQELLRLLRLRGLELPVAPGAERFKVAGTLVEVPFEVETMETRLARFDLGLSCIGVAFRSDGAVCFIHPLALDSIVRRELLLIRIARVGLVLATLLRLRKYSSDVGYTIPVKTEEKLWGIHCSLSREERQQQIHTLQFHYGNETFGVLQEAQKYLDG